jgi:CubicO group peptidase (beta-lactamase class C family)
VPELRLRDEDAAARVTLRHCLTHYAGWFGDHFIDTGEDGDALAKYVASMAGLEQQVPLGTEWAYNNAAFNLAGHVVERATGQPIETAMRTQLFEPLGLERTFFFAHEVMTHRFAVGHNVFGERPEVVRRWALPRASNCVGGIVSTVPDLLRYAKFHMGDGTTADGARYLSADAALHMRSPLLPGALGDHRGIAWLVQSMDGVRIIGHGGATFGQLALLNIAPDRRFAVAMLTNSNRATQLQNRVLRWARQRYLGITPKVPEPRPHTADEAAAVTGTYRNPSNELRIELANGALVLHQRPLDSGFRKLQGNPPPVPDPAPLAFTTSGRLVLTSGPLKDTQIELLRPEWVRFSSRLYRRAIA